MKDKNEFLTDEVIKEADRVKKELESEVVYFIGNKELEDFKKFAFKSHIIGMSVAFIMGASFKNVVSSLSGNIMMPILNYLVNFTGGEWRARNWKPLEGLTIETGKFSGDFLDFIMVSVALYLICKLITHGEYYGQENTENKGKSTNRCNKEEPFGS